MKYALGGVSPLGFVVWMLSKWLWLDLPEDGRRFLVSAPRFTVSFNSVLPVSSLGLRFPAMSHGKLTGNGGAAMGSGREVVLRLGRW